MNSLLKCSGLQSTADVSISTQKWGRNEFDIPVPSFFDLFGEHLVAPFFVFQVLCLFLWSLDDYWYYSVFTLFMLMFFEGMLCKQRQASLFMLRNMRRPPVDIYSLRGNQWVEISSEELVPGDVISLKAEVLKKKRRNIRRDIDDDYKEDAVAVVPCDALILRGVVHIYRLVHTNV
jgi:cation-transporting ATPase 13A1